MVVKIPEEEAVVVEEEKFPFCMKCRTEVNKKNVKFCPSCRGLVLYYTEKQIATFKNQKAKMLQKAQEDDDYESPAPKKSKKSNIPRLLTEEEYNPQKPFQKQMEDGF